jgi:hypothetical protein
MVPWSPLQISIIENHEYNVYIYIIIYIYTYIILYPVFPIFGDGYYMLLPIILSHQNSTQKRGIRAKATQFGSEMERELWPGESV